MSGDDNSAQHTLPTGDVTLSAGGSVRVVATELPSSATLAECRGKVTSSASPLRFGRRPRAVRVHVASEGIVETVPLELSLPHSKVLSSLCQRFELPTTNEYVLATMVNGEYVTLDARQTLLQSGAGELWLRVDAEAGGAASESDVNIWDEPSGTEF
jgi:hypothetical protein